MSDRSNNALEKKITEIRGSVKRKREELFALETDDAWDKYFQHLHKNLEAVCACNSFLKEYLQSQVSTLKKREARKRLSIPKCRETKALVDDDSPIVFASRRLGTSFFYF